MAGLCDNAGEMSPGSNVFARIGLRENPGKNLNQVTCPDRDSNPGHLVSQPDALTVTPQRNPVTQTSYYGWGAHRANHTIPPFWLDDRPPLLRHVDLMPAAGCFGEIGDSEMIFGEMRPRIRHRLSDICLIVGENLGKNPTSDVIVGTDLPMATVECDFLRLRQQFPESPLKAGPR
ncbi:hypothetical protein ANN_03516 [Periplaneta americana]|uniref:Uncharacterized protein n=1 Tax=Periplaneta americana TaxID=6978 RepID=A0ABQ8TZ33_PERAM|nr:hypothetical protein ANN_03516 [Periplaneta americana]